MALFKHKKGNVNKVPATVMVLGLSAIIGGLILIILTSVAATTTDANATEAITNAKNGIVKVFSFFVLIGLVFAAGIMIKMLMRSFA